MNIYDCPFILGDNGLWFCPQCEKAHPLPLEKAPYRTCPKVVVGVDAVLTKVGNYLGQTAALDNGEWTEIERRIRICYDSKCKHFKQFTCTERGSSCKHFVSWIQRLCLSTCEAWETKPSTTET